MDSRRRKEFLVSQALQLQRPIAFNYWGRRYRCEVRRILPGPLNEPMAMLRSEVPVGRLENPLRLYFVQLADMEQLELLEMPHRGFGDGQSAASRIA